MSDRLAERREKALKELYARRAVEDAALTLGAELRDIEGHKRANMDQIETLIARKPDGLSVVRLAKALKMSRSQVYQIKKQAR